MKNIKNIKKVGLYNPYLDVFGGGEKYILSILKVFDELNFKIDVFWDKNISQEINNRFSLKFRNLNFLPNLFKRKSFFNKLIRLKKYDLFFYITNGSYFFSTAKKNFVYAMIPDKKLYQLNFINRLKLINWQFFTHSFFNQKNLEKWSIKTNVLYPYIDDIFFYTQNVKKEKTILSVGRFFPQLHSKHQELIISTFNRLNKIGDFKSFKLILAGSFKKEDEKYFNNLKKLAKKNPNIIFKPNLSINQLINIYHKSMFFWHFTGYGINEKENPEMVEHLGITPLEAMASGLIVFCYNAGGPKEIIKDGKTGFLFSNEQELIKKILLTKSQSLLRKRIIKQGQEFIKKNFSYQVFKENVKKIFL